MSKITDLERSTRLGIKQTLIPKKGKGLSLFKQADSIGDGRGDSRTLEEAPGSATGDDNTTSPDKSNDSREPSKVFKDKHLKDDSGRPSRDHSGADYGNRSVRENSSVFDDKEPTGDSPEKTLRGSKIMKSNFKPSKKVLAKKNKKAKRRKKKSYYTIEDVHKIDPNIARAMYQRGVYRVNKSVFKEQYGEYIKDKARVARKAHKKKMAEHNHRMSDKWRKEKKGSAIVEYYDNWDVEWNLYKAKDYVKRGSKSGEYKSAEEARRAAQGKGDGNYVIEGTSIRDGAYWGYYVVSIKDNKTTRYQKLYLQPKESGVTHENTYKKASKTVLGEITPEKFMADSATAGRYVRARLSKRASKALGGLYRSGQRVMDQISVGKRQFPEQEDRGSMRAIMETIDQQFEKLKMIVDMLDAPEQEKIMNIAEEVEELTGADVDMDNELGEPEEHVEMVEEADDDIDREMDDVFGGGDEFGEEPDDLELPGAGPDIDPLGGDDGDTDPFGDDDDDDDLDLFDDDDDDDDDYDDDDGDDHEGHDHKPKKSPFDSDDDDDDDDDDE
mgnify:CR=1 FL=1